MPPVNNFTPEEESEKNTTFLSLMSYKGISKVWADCKVHLHDLDYLGFPQNYNIGKLQ